MILLLIFSEMEAILKLNSKLLETEKELKRIIYPRKITCLKCVIIEAAASIELVCVECDNKPK